MNKNNEYRTNLNIKHWLWHGRRC